MTLFVCDLNNFGFCGKDLKTFCEMTDIFAPVSNSAIVGCSCTVTWYIVLVPCMEPSLITMVASAPSQSDLGWEKSECCLNRFSRSSLFLYY